MKPSEFGRKVRAVIEKGWTQGEHARDERGCGVRINSPSATCFCIVGGVRLVTTNHRAYLSIDQFERVLAHIVHPGPHPRGYARAIVEFNDAPGRTQAEVLAAIDEAIGKCEDLELMA